jgi:hypothetical protein
LKIFFELKLRKQFYNNCTNGYSNNINNLKKTKNETMNCELIKSNVQFRTEMPQVPSSFFKSDFYKTNQTTTGVCYSSLSKQQTGGNGIDFRYHTNHQRATNILQSTNKLEFMFNRIKNVLTKNKVNFFV